MSDKPAAGRRAGTLDALLDRFTDGLWLEDGLSRNTLDSYRRDLRRVEYGDERDSVMRAFLERISPVTQAHRITKPLLVAQGANDPRVPRTESEQMVATLRKRGTPVWYLLGKNEGHGFRKKENADYLFYATVRFIQEFLLAPTP